LNAEAKSPLFRDPIHDGAADPTVIWNRIENSWWIIYTNRRANIAGPGLAWFHGTDLGVASSVDGGRSWLYRGTLGGLAFEPGRNTYWAPEVIFHEDCYHMYLSYLPGVPEAWTGPAHIVHYTSTNLWDWDFESVLRLSSDRVIDACIDRLPNGRWRMWYKDERHGQHTYAADSEDLYHWSVVGPVITDRQHEGPNVFFWRGAYWMVTDPWHGIAVYRSHDAENWRHQGVILSTASKRQDDGPRGHHADVLVLGDDAYIFYHTHPGAKGIQQGPDLDYGRRRSSLHCARLELTDGKICCLRDGLELAFDHEMAAAF
jgi:hypothetical protein